MTPRGAQALIAMRLAGQRPAGPVWINYGDLRQPGSPRDGRPLAVTDWAKWEETSAYPELLVRPEDPIDRLDFRCVVDLPVVLFFKTYSDRAALLFEKLKEYAREITVMSPDFDRDIGWTWSRERGQVDLAGSSLIRKAA